MHNLKKHSTVILFSLILLVAAFTRFYKLSEFPVGLHGDEASLAYNAYSLLLTGKDENGDFLPIHSSISLTYRPIGYTYLTIPSVLVFGLNEFSARFAGALLGTLTVGAVYLLAIVLFKKKSTALMSALFLALNPWHINLSRGSAESLASLFFVVCGFILIIKLIQDKRTSFLYVFGSFFLFTLAFITYPASRVFVPLFLSTLVPLTFFFYRRKMRLTITLSVIAFSISGFFILGTKGGIVKFNDVGILSYELPKALLAESIGEDGTVFIHPLVARLFHNKVIVYGRVFIKEYVQYFSFNTLVGGEILPIRYKIQDAGLIYIVEVLFLLVGIYSVFRTREFALLFVACWILVGPLASAMTWEDSPNVLRSLPMVVGLVLMMAYGSTHLWQLMKNKSYRNLLFGVIIITYIYCVLTYMHQYYIHGLRHRPWYRDYGFKELIQFTESKPEYEVVYVTKATAGPYIQFLFHLKFDPREYHQTNSVRDDNYMGFGRYIFVPDECPDPVEFQKRGILDKNAASTKVLFVANGLCKVPLSVHELTYITRPDNTPVFRIWEIKN